MAKRQPGQKKNAPTIGKKARTAARRKAAARRRLMIRGGTGVVGIAAVAGLVWLATGAGGTGVTDTLAWDLPAMGPTADTQERVTLAEFSGSPTVVNFFASWCVECDRELPGFATVSDELRGQVDFVGIASQETGDELLMPERHGITWWPLAEDVSASAATDGGTHSGGAAGNRDGLSRALGARGMPLTAFYDAAGQLVDIQLGALSEGQLREKLNTLYGLDI